MAHIMTGTGFGQVFEIKEGDKKKGIKKYGIMKK